MDAFLDVDGIVRALATLPRTIEDIQVKNPGVTQKIADAPSGLRPWTIFTPRDPLSVSYHQLTSGDGSSIDHYTLRENLGEYKKRRYEEIDARTRALIDTGFVFDDTVFSLSLQAQINLNRLRTNLLTGVLTALDFPRPYSRIDNQDYIINNIRDASDLYATGDNRLDQRIRSGNNLKNQVRAATTKAEIDAITDDRLETDPPADTISAKRQELLTANYVDWKYEVIRERGNRVQSVKRYTTDNGNGNYTGLVQELLYSYQGNKLLDIVTNTYDSDGNLIATETEVFYKDGRKTTIRKFE